MQHGAIADLFGTQHPNVLELLGASSCSSNPPWFFVSPYMFNGNLVQYLKDHAGEKTNHLQMVWSSNVGRIA